ncbi:PLP-dependent aminotransferase family protein [Acidaminobacter sp. JC074]|uniref:MocR-like pyridoxine biosynthesis transcription factor PdxR n=1 Tax=Acidaminobacter sp. JC074 TaxID=2530199 RepID=UPI001F10E86C|nr:PLP-dependent aminotransferase family protein [Acidaminobacter sp. JC074]MCH4887026.1 PLP-dependent aminotransferase family protein [Acidaminobacter sp. JC074]
MTIKINHESHISIYMQIYHQIKNRIIDGDLHEGDRLLSERKLSQVLNVNRTTILSAYDLLKADGLIDSFSGKGTFVIYKTIQAGDHNNYYDYDFEGMYLKHHNGKHDDVIKMIMDDGIRRSNIFFAGGLPAENLIPNEAFHDIYRDLLNDKTLNVLSSSDVSGVKTLKQMIKNLMIESSPSLKEILVTSGAQQALDLIFKTFLIPGDAVIVEEPTFFGALQLLKHYGVKTVTVPMDNQGMDTGVLAYLIERHHPKFIYTIPTYHNPTGISMSLERRKDLLKIASHYNVAIIEDDPYSGLVYEESYPSLKSLSKSNHVIYVSTFSKTLSLGLRIGWVTASEEVIKLLVRNKQISDLHVNTLNQYALASFIESGSYRAHVIMVTEFYRRKRNLMIQMLKKHFEDIEYECPKGGYYIWLRLSSDVSIRKLFDLCKKKGVMMTPGYHFSQSNGPYIRLNFSYPSEEEIISGIKIISDCYNELRK